MHSAVTMSEGRHPEPLAGLHRCVCVAMIALLLLRGAAPAQCVGDCSGDNVVNIEVTIDELLVMVNVALGSASLTDCLAGDANTDDQITIEEILLAVNNALNGCPPVDVVTVLRDSSPPDGEAGVAVTRETVLHFSAPLDAATITSSTIYAEFGGARLQARLHISPDRQTVTLFFLPPLPASARVRITVDGNLLHDARRRPIDGDGDGIAGGVGVLEFDTLTVTALRGTVVYGRVFASELSSTAAGIAVDVPLQGVTITVDGQEETLRATTDAAGNFRLDPAPAGRFFVHIDGRRATNPVPIGAYYPFVGKAWESRPGAETNIGNVYLPLIPPLTLQLASTTSDTEITFPSAVLAAHPELEGVSIVVPADALYSEDGTRGGNVGIAPVPPDRIPGPLPPGLNFPIVITVQTDAASNFDRPVPVCFPNLPDPTSGEPLPANSKSALWSFNHDTGEFEVVGPMTVSADGRLVCTDPGIGILAPGWHGTQPGSPGADQVPMDPLPEDEATDEDCTLPQGITAKNGVTITGLSKEICDTFDNIVDTWNDNDAPDPVITSNNDSKHKGSNQAGTDCSTVETCRSTSDSRHYDDQAVDLRGNNVTDDALRTMADDLQESLGDDYDVQAEIFPNMPANDHIHVEYDPQTGELQYVFNLARTRSTFSPRATEPGIVPGHDYILLSFANGLVLRLVSSPAGLVRAILPPNQYAELSVYDPETKHFIFSDLFTAPSGFPTRFFHQTDADWEAFFDTDTNGSPDMGQLHDPDGGGRAESGESFAVGAPYYWYRGSQRDTDADGLVDAAEAIVGTSPSNPDTDGDGINDGAEVDQATNPLDGVAVQTGIVASADTPGVAVDVCVGADLAVIADSTAGVSIFNVFNGMSPTIIAQVNTPGTARAVACNSVDASGRLLIAVADGARGLAVLDVTDPPAAHVLHQVELGGDAVAVTVSGDTAFVGLASGAVAAVSLSRGEVLKRIDTAASVHDLVIADDALFVLLDTALQAFDPAPDSLNLLGSASATAFRADSLTGRKRLFVGGGIAYAASSVGYDTFDVRTPASMARRGTAEDGGPRSFKHIVATSSGLGVAAVGVNPTSDGTHDAWLYDVSDPLVTNRFLTTLETPDVARAVFVHQGLAYVADGAAGLQVINYVESDQRGVPPTVALSTNFAPGRAEAGAPVRVTADARDDVQVRIVRFSVDGVDVATDGSFPFEYRFNAPALAQQASFTLRACATDTGGNTACTSEIVEELVPDATPPRIMQTTPANGGIYRAGEDLVALWNEPIEASLLTAATFHVFAVGPDEIPDTEDDGPEAIGVVSYRQDLRAAIFAPTAPLAAGLYRAVLRRTITDLAGNPLANDRAWAFIVPADIRLGGTMAARLQTPGEKDVYRLVAEVGDLVRIRMSTPGDIDPRIEVFDARGVQLADESTFANVVTVDLSIAAEGPLHIVLSDVVGVGIGDYGISIQRLNTLADAVPISTGQVLARRLDALAELDAYTLSATAGDVLRVRMSSPGEVDPQIEVLDAQGIQLGEASTFANEVSLELLVAATGPLSILVADFEGRNTGDYGITIQRLNGPAGAIAVGAGQTIGGRFNALTELDAYTIAVAAGDVLRIRMSSPGEVDPRIEVFDADGVKLVEASSFSNEASLDMTVASTGTMTVLLADVEGQSIGAYGLSVQRLNSPAGALPIAPGQVLSRQINALAELDAYTLNATMGDVLRIRMSSPGDLNPRIEVFDPQGVRLAQNMSFSNEVSIDVTVAATGALLILATDVEGTSMGAYGVSVQRLNNPAAAVQIAIGQQLSGQLDALAEVDAYTLTAVARDMLRIRMRSLGEVDPRIEVFNTQGTQLSEASSFGNEVSIEIMVAATGLVHILLADVGGDNLGGYTLGVERIAAPVE